MLLMQEEHPTAALPEGIWAASVRNAVSEQELMQVAHAFVASWPANEIALLPPKCHPKRLRSARDVSLLTFRLKSAYCAPFLAAEQQPAIERMAAFFDALSGRIFELRSAAPASLAHAELHAD